MSERKSSPQSGLMTLRESMGRLYHSHKWRKAAWTVATVLVVFGLLGVFAAPPIIRSQLQTRLSAQLQRPVSIQQVHLNPFTLRLALDGLHIGDHDGHGRFIDIDRLIVNASWSSLFRRAPILDQIELDHPQILIRRDTPQQFNFSDIIERFNSTPATRNAAPTRFALSNISVHRGDILFDDHVLNAQHEVSRLELGIPFIANLPSSVNVFVQPLLAMTLDGSAIRLQGQTKPFADSRESVLNFHLASLDLPRYLSYSPTPLPVKVVQGQLSGDLALHFVADPKTPILSVSGTLQLDQLNVNTADGGPLLSMHQAQAELVDVQPLLSHYRLGSVKLDTPELHYISLPDGHSNIDALLGNDKPAQAAKPDAPKTALDIATLQLTAAHLIYTDRTGKTPAELSLDALHGSIDGFSTVAKTAAKVDMASQLQGGSLKLQGGLDLQANRFVGQIALDGVDVAPLQAIGDPSLAADLSGKLGATGQLLAAWGTSFDIQLNTAQTTLDDVVLKLHRRSGSGIHWTHLQVGINQFQLGNHQVSLGSVDLQGLSVDAQRLANGNLDLAELASTPAAAVHSSRHATKAPAPAAWHWRVDHFALGDGAIALTDRKTAGKPQVVKVSKISIKADGLSDDMRHAFKLDTAGTIGKRGSYSVAGTVKPQPLDAQLRVKTTRLDLAPLQSYIDIPLNVTMSSALLSIDGRVRYLEQGKQPKITYRGRVTLGRVRVQDKVSGDDFVRWTSLSANGLNVHLGDAAPKVDVGSLALDDFYARLILNSNGRTNLQDVVANPSAGAPVSVTRAQTGPAPAAPSPATSTPATPTPAAPASTAPSAATATTATPTTSATPAAEIHIGGITLSRGQLNYTDNFVKPNYTANMTQLVGKVGSFGTVGGAPAPLSVQGSLDDNSPLDIEGTINPLAPVAFLDITGKADGVELTHMSTYSSKYTGYPIIKGRLNANVHYNLDNGKLNADNHINIDQLTFGDRIEGKGIGHLPVKLAVALLKDSQGRIDIDLPVSGSLDDPQFSIGGLVWHAFINLIGKAITSPFRLLGSAFGGGAKQDLGYVEFTPGSAVLDATAQQRLTLIVKALSDRPSLNLDITGRTDPTKDESGLRSVTVEQLVRDEQHDDEGSNADDKTTSTTTNGKTAPPTLSPDDYNKYLAAAYKHAKIKKPRNLVGLHKSESPDTMKSMLEASVPTDQDAMRHLAERRAEAVRTWLQGKVDDKRLFVLAPKLDANGIDDKGLTTRVDFGLH